MSDNVSRQAVLSILNGFEVMDGHTDQQRAIHMVELLPSTDRTGHWEIYVISPFDGEGCRCSECGTEGAPYWGYCPNCGADMRGEQNEQMD